MSNKSYSDIARHIKRGAESLINGGWRGYNGVCWHLANLDNGRFGGESYYMMHYFLGNIMYFNSLGYPGNFSDKRKALCRKLAGLSLRTLRRYAAEMSKARKLDAFSEKPARAFSFLADS